MPQCESILARGPSKGSRCKNNALPNLSYCSRHKPQSVKQFKYFQLLNLPMDIIIDMGKFLDYKDGLSFIKITKEVHSAFCMPDKNTPLWNAWFLNLQKTNNIEFDVSDVKTKRYIINLYCYKQCQKCQCNKGTLNTDLLVRLCRECLLDVSLSQSKLSSYYRIPRSILDNIKHVRLSFGYGSTGTFFIIKHVNQALGMTIDEYRKNSMSVSKKLREQSRKKKSETLAHQKSVRLQLTKNALNILKSDPDMQGVFALTRLKQFDAIKSLDVTNIQDLDQFDEKQMDMLIDAIKNEHKLILSKKSQIDTYLEGDLPSFETLPLRKQYVKFNELESQRDAILSNWNSIKPLGKWKASEVDFINEQFEIKAAGILVEMIRLKERIRLLRGIERDISVRSKRIFDGYIRRLRRKCRENDMKQYPSLKTKHGRYQILIMELENHGLKLRGDSQLCNSYISGSIHNPLGEIIAITKITKYLFSYSHIHFSNFHVEMREELLQQMYRLKNTERCYDWWGACIEAINKRKSELSQFSLQFGL